MRFLVDYGRIQTFSVDQGFARVVNLISVTDQIRVEPRRGLDVSVDTRQLPLDVRS
jgi:hypothetical protein